jgi:hypothetical protein
VTGVRYGPAPEGEDPDDELFEELVWSVMEERPEREVLVCEQFHHLDDEHEIGLQFKNNYSIDATWFAHVRLLYRDENHQPSQLNDLWTPASAIPLDVLRDCHPGEVVDWFATQGQGFEPWRATESVFVRPPSEDDRLLLHLDRNAPVLRCCSHYFTRDDELLLVHASLLTTDHLLGYQRHIPWERELESGSQGGGGDR